MIKVLFILLASATAILSCKDSSTSNSRRTHNKDTIIDKYFYPDGKLRGEFHHYYKKNDTLHDGYTKEYYNSGVLKFYGSYKDGLKAGTWVWYYENGSIEQTCFYEDGKIFGGSFSFYPNKQMESYRFRTSDEHIMYLRDYDSLGNITREDGFPYVISYIDTQFLVNDTFEPWVDIGVLSDWKAKVLVKDITNGADKVIKDTLFSNPAGKNAFLRELAIEHVCKNKGNFYWTVDMSIFDKKYNKQLHRIDTLRFPVK